MLIAGCASGAPGGKARATNPGKPFSTALVAAGTVLTRYGYSDKGHRIKLWNIRWQTADLAFDDSGEFSGTMEGVHGVLFKDGRESSTFEARTGTADKSSRVLLLEGSVVVESKDPSVKSKDPSGRMECESMRWDPDREIIEATGNVRLETKEGILGPFDSLWFSPELKVAGTPDMFKEKIGDKRS